MLCINIMAYAQATDLIVDCQTPGWLSSKITYGEQISLKNLTVTGYINETDLKFIGTLIKKHNLTGKLDLSAANIISENPNTKDNYLGKDAFGIKPELGGYKDTLSCLILPNTLELIYESFWNGASDNNSSQFYLHADTLFFNWAHKSLTTYGYYSDPNHLYDSSNNFNFHATNLYLGENIDSIASDAYYGHAFSIVESLHLSSNIKYIGDNATGIRYHSGDAKELRTLNINDLVNLEYLGVEAFPFVMPDTLVIPPKLKVFNVNAFGYKNGQHIFIGEVTKSLKNTTWENFGTYSNKTVYCWENVPLTFHMQSSNPPSLEYSRLSSIHKVYVPKGSRQAYMNSDWKNATIIEMNPVEKIMLNTHEIVLNANECATLFVSYEPEDSDDKNVIWSSNDSSIATIDHEGNLLAISPGQTYIYVKSIVEGVKDSCLVTVRKNVEEIIFDVPHIELTSIGVTQQLNIIFTPSDATDQNIIWRSTDESVCIVTQNGMVIAVGTGTAVIIATTEDGGYIATCTVTVNNETNINSVNEISKYPFSIHDVIGRQQKRIKKGINIIKMSDGTTKKVLVK